MLQVYLELAEGYTCAVTITWAFEKHCAILFYQPNRYGSRNSSLCHAIINCRKRSRRPAGVIDIGEYSVILRHAFRL